MNMVYGPHNFLFNLFPILFLAVFGLAIGIIISGIVKNSAQNHKNNNSPQITSETTVVTKRTHVWGDHSHTDYYATFEFESGDRLELSIPHSQFGYLVEGDHGKLTFQGTRFIRFERTR